jgi:hypothetical protein
VHLVGFPLIWRGGGRGGICVGVVFCSVFFEAGLGAVLQQCRLDVELGALLVARMC